MMKRTIFGSLVLMATLFSGCGDSSESTCRIDVQLAIDAGDYDSAVSALEGNCASAYSQSDLKYNLATAYMGKAGYGVSDVISMLVDAGDASNGSAFSSFINSANESTSGGNSSIYLDKAKLLYLESVTSDANATIDTLCNRADLNTTTNTRFSASCLYLGLNQTLQTVNTILLLTKDVDTLISSIDGSATTPLDMQASLDALSWAIDANATLSNVSSITPSDVNISGSPYTHLIVLNNGETFFRLAKSSVRDSNNSTVLTDGYCDTNGSKVNCSDIEDNTTNDGSVDLTKSTGCYACPVDFGSGENQDIAILLVDALNGGTGAISNVTNDASIQQSIDDFKIEIGGSADANITIDNILQYLNK